MKRDSLNILGLMSGSSLDGLDIALCNLTQDDNEKISSSVIKTASASFPSNLEHNLRSATSLSMHELKKLEITFSQYCASAVNDFQTDIGVDIDYIASHGHTISHFPQEGFTLQIGCGATISALTNIPCITDFRSNDIARGGQGAPLAPIVEQLLYPGYDYYFNLGGIANFSVHKQKEILSIDSCPCNQVLNSIMNSLGKSYDDQGMLARSGKISDTLISQWLELKYFHDPYPKSMDNTWVKDVFISIMERSDLKHQDKLASMVEFIGIQLVRDISSLGLDHPPPFIGLITGGGAFNDFLVERISYHFDGLNLKLKKPSNELINFKEAILMALMGYLRIQKIPNTIPSVTGASFPTIGGALYLP